MTEETPDLPEVAGAPPKPLKQILEAVLFSSQKPMSVKELCTSLKGAAESGDPSAVAYAKTKEPALREALTELAVDCAEEGRTYEIRETASGWQLVTRAEFAPWLRQLYPENRPARLSAPALETLAIIAYRQPITRADIEAVRGVAVDGVMQTLLDRGLVKIAGRSEVPGRPLLYETTQFFMEHFGLKDLDELPNSGELRRIELPKAPIPEEPASPGAPAAETEAPAPEEPEVAGGESPSPGLSAYDSEELPPAPSDSQSESQADPIEPTSDSR
jgi:segregation and condensation protein B